MKRGRSMHSMRPMPLSVRVASMYAMLVAATLLVAAGLALQFTRSQLSGQLDRQLNSLAKSFDSKVPGDVQREMVTGTAFVPALVDQSKLWLSNASFVDGEGALVAIRNLPPPNVFRPLGVYDPRDEVGRLAEGFDRMLGRLQEAILSLRRFLSDASHELRTPMTVVRGQLELLAMDVESLTGRRLMSIAIEELDRMGRIVEDLLLLARLDEGMPLARDSVEVELVVGEALLRAMLGAGDVRVQVVPELCILGDADRLLQVLTNLITNAVRHGRNAPITVTGRPEGDYVKIEVSDRGPGISPEDLPHVFERLYRGSKARSESPGGAGLGLAIALSLVKAMDGSIDVVSTPGVGTTFTVTLPGAAPVSSYRMPVGERKRSPAV